MACCVHCSRFVGEDSEVGPICGGCRQPVRYCSDEICSTEECALTNRALDYFGLAESGSSDEDLRTISRRGPRWDPFY
jgi:hypothetical protein